MVDDKYLGGANRFGILGDIYPSNIDYSDGSNTPELFKMYHRNEFVQIMCDWMVSLAFKDWILFIEDEDEVEGIKFGEPYTFKGYEYDDPESGKHYSVTPFQEFLQWNDVPENFQQGASWSRLYDQGALLVFLDSNEDLIQKTKDKKGNTTVEWAANPNPQGYTRFIVYQPHEAGTGTGFRVDNLPEDVNSDGSVKTWTVQLQTQHMTKSITFRIDAERCIHLLWKKRQNGWAACSRVAPFLRFAKMEELTFQKLTKRAHDIAGGILKFIGVESSAEQAAIDAACGSDLTSVDRLFLKMGREADFITPDLKAAGEFASIFELYTKKICRFMRIDQLMLDGEHTGASLGGNDNIQQQNSYTEIYEIQEHYRNYLEKIFYKLGKKNTSFVYREILSQEKEMQMEQFEHENEQLEQSAQLTKGADSGNKESAGNKSTAGRGETTR